MAKMLAKVVRLHPARQSSSQDKVFMAGVPRAELANHAIFTLIEPCSVGDVGHDIIVHKTAVMRRRDGTLMDGDDPGTIVFRLENAVRLQSPPPVLA